MVVELALVLVMRGLLVALGLLVLGLLVRLALLPLALPALVLAGTRAQRPEQLTTRRTRPRDEAPGLVRGRQLPRHRGAVAVAAA